jgi:hypothetical protein
MTPRFISALTVMQLFIVFLGVSLTGAFLRLHSAGGAPNPAFPQFMRDYGFWFALLPLAWAFASTISVRSLDSTPSASSLYCAAGFVLLAALLLVFAFGAYIAFYVATGGPEEMLPMK